jgi:hypothetical protein
MRTKVAALVAALALGTAGAAHAGLPVLADHLRCHKIKDTALKVTYTGTLQSGHPAFPDEACTIKTPAKLLCTPVTKTIVGEVPGVVALGAIGGGLEEQFACYKVKCEKTTFDVEMSDQFGTRSMTVKAPKWLCAPANFAAVAPTGVLR